MSTLIANKYRLLRLITRIGRSELYQAENVILGKEISLLLLSAGFSAAEESEFLEQTRRIAKVNHPGILNLSDIGGDTKGNRFAILEAATGRLLAEILEERPEVTADIAISIARRAAQALKTASEHSLIHGSLSTSKILVSLDDENVDAVKIFGFGSQVSQEDQLFQAPERMAGSPPDSRSDMFSLAAIIYRMLTGQMPFADTGNTETPPVPLSAYRTDIAPEFEAVIVQALSADPNARPTADDFLLSLERTDSTNTSEKSQIQSSLEKWKTAAIILIGVCVLAAALIYATGGSIKTDPAATAQPVPGSLPVQPINPATGVEEENLAKLPLTTAETNSNTSASADTLPGGDGYNPWANGGVPPPGAPLPPPGQTITINPGQSPFMQDSNCIMQPSGILLCPVPVTPTPTPKTTPTPKAGTTPAANTNTAATPQQPTPSPETKEQRTTPTPSKPAKQNTNRPPAESGTQNGAEGF